MGNKKCIRDMPAPVSGAYVSRCLLAVILLLTVSGCKTSIVKTELESFHERTDHSVSRFNFNLWRHVSIYFSKCILICIYYIHDTYCIVISCLQHLILLWKFGNLCVETLHTQIFSQFVNSNQILIVITLFTHI